MCSLNHLGQFLFQLLVGLDALLMLALEVLTSLLYSFFALFLCFCLHLFDFGSLCRSECC